MANQLGPVFGGAKLERDSNQTTRLGVQERLELVIESARRNPRIAITTTTDAAGASHAFPTALAIAKRGVLREDTCFAAAFFATSMLFAFGAARRV